MTSTQIFNNNNPIQTSSIQFSGASGMAAGTSGIVICNLTANSVANPQSPDSFSNVPFDESITLTDVRAAGSSDVNAIPQGTVSFSGLFNATNVTSTSLLPGSTTWVTPTSATVELGANDTGWNEYAVQISSFTPPGAPGSFPGSLQAVVTITTGVAAPLTAGALTPPGAGAGQIFEVNNNGFAGLGTIGHYTTAGATVNPTLVSGLGAQNHIAVAGSNLFLTVESNDTLEEYTTSGAVVNASLVSGLNAPYGIAASGSDLFVLLDGSGSNTIAEYTTSGALVNASLVSGLNGPDGIAVSGSDLFVTNYSSGTVGEYTTSGATVNAALVTGLNDPFGIVVSGTDLYVLNRGNGSNGSIGEYTTSGATVNAAQITGLSDGPEGIALSGSDLFVANDGLGTAGAGSIGEYTTSGATVNASLISGLYEPTGIAVTPPPVTEGQAFTNQTVFHFTDANPNATASQFTAVVTLGDGNSVTLTGTPSANGQIVADPNGGFDVQLSYTYAEYLNNATFGVTVTDGAGGSASASTSTFSVADAPLSATGTAVSATAGVPLSNVQVGTLTDAAGTYSNPSDLSATINWGDGTAPSAGTLTLTPSNPTASTFASGLPQPSAVAFDASGNLYVTNYGTGTVSEYSPSGALLNANFISGLDAPTGIAIDSSGNFYVPNFNAGTVSEYNSSGAILNPTLISGLDGPFNVAFDSIGNLYVANYISGTVSEFNSSGGLISASFASGLNGPIGLAFDASGNLYVANYGGQTTVSEFNSSGALVNAAFASGLNGAWGLAFDHSGNLYVSNVNIGTVSKFNSAGALINAAYVSGVGEPAGLAFDSSGNLFVCNGEDSGTITKVIPGTPGLYTVEGSHTYASYGSYTISVSYKDAGGSTTTSTSTATVADAPLTAGALTPPGGTAGGLIFVANTGDNTIGAYRMNGSTVSNSFISGLDNPVGIAVSGSDLFVANSGNGTIGEYTTSGATVNASLISGLSLVGPAAIGVSGSDLFIANNGGDTIGEYTTSGATVDASLISGLTNDTGPAASGSDLFVPNVGSGTVAEYTTSGTLVNASLISGLDYPYAIAASGSDLFVVNYYPNTIGEYTTSGAVVNASLISGLNGPFGLAVSGSDLFVDNVGFYYEPAGVVGEYTTSGGIVNASLASGPNSPFGIAVSQPTLTEGQPFTNQNVFHFTDANPNATASQFTAVVALGNGSSVTLTGTPSANGQIVADPNGGFDVRLSYTYAEYLTNATFGVTVTDAGGASTSVSTSTFSVADAPLSATGTAVSATQGAALTNVQVGTLTDAAGKYSNPSDLSAMINWGDGTPSSPATLVEVGTSGVYTVEGSHTYATYGSYTVTVNYLDAGGSTTSSTSTATVAGGPMTTANLAGTLGNNNWYVSAVNVTLSATDAVSPIAHTYYSIDGGVRKTYAAAFSVSSQGSHTIDFYSVDKAGDTESTESTSFQIDSVKPTTTDILSGTLGTNNWYTTPVTVTLNAVDPNGAIGSGVAQTFYQVDVGPLTTYTGTFTVSSQGSHTISFYSVDNAGNTEKTESDSFKIDTTAPTTTDALAGTLGNNSWWVSAVKVTLTANDSTSGIAQTYYSLDGGSVTTYSGAFSVSSQGSHTVSFYSVNKAGNQEIASTITFQIDSLKPTTVANLTGTLGANGSYTTPVQVTLTASDAGSGVAQTYYQVDGGILMLYTGAFTVSGSGKHTITFYSVDNAGNIEKTETDSFKIA